MFNCSKCGHKWFQRTEQPPRRCPNHSCRTVYWNINVSIKPVAEKKSAVPSELNEKKETLNTLQSIIDSVIQKPIKRSDYYTQSVLPEYHKPVDQPDYYDTERSVNYD